MGVVQQQAEEKIALIHESQQKLLDNLRESLLERTGMLEEQLSDCRREAATLQSDNTGLRSSLAAVQTRLEESQKRGEEKVALVNEAQQRLGDTFKALSAEVLENNNQAFLHLATATMEKFQEGARNDLESRRKSIDDLIQPLRSSLQKVDLSVTALEKNRAAAYAGLTEQVGILLDGQALLRQETTGLVKALRAPAAGGSWGEIQLRRVVELAGMVEYCDFEQRQTGEKANGAQHPDLLVRLPNGRLVVVDAKAPLQAYLEAMESTSEAGRQAKLAEHASLVRAHMAHLGSKKYWKQFTEVPEFAVAFLPGETFLSAALEQDPGLIEFGVEQTVILATPTTLIALLKAVSYGWQQNKLAVNARQISQLGQALYDRLYTFSGHVEDLRRNLQRTVDSYNKAAGVLESRVLVTARKFKELGAAGDAEIDFLEPVDTFPRGLQALDQVTLDPGTVPGPVHQEEAVPGSV
ncbi:MAG: DNA recombination protein RmuC [Acidobacteriia bacterium]|nr:DNA recombination protein RmuC [Terriglobia bacterium]